MVAVFQGKPSPAFDQHLCGGRSGPPVPAQIEIRRQLAPRVCEFPLEGGEAVLDKHRAADSDNTFHWEAGGRPLASDSS